MPLKSVIASPFVLALKPMLHKPSLADFKSPPIFIATAINCVGIITMLTGMVVANQLGREITQHSNKAALAH